jgi:L-iditol 2-dehydrogenase
VIGLAKLAPGSGNVGLIERPEPVVSPGHVVLAVEAAGICGTDLHIVDDEFRSSPPVTMGHEACGVVVEVGEGVDPRWLDRRVVSETYFSTCGACEHCRTGRSNLCPERRSIGSAVDGAFAPRLLVPARGLHRVPDWLPSRTAALAEPLACVCHCLLDPPVVRAGDDVLVVGPGPMGLLAAQAARSGGARVHVVGTERDSHRLALARELGCDTSSGDQVSNTLLQGGSPRLFDVVVECSGSQGGIATCLEHARRGGRYVQVGLAGKPVAVLLDEVCFRELTITSGNASTPASWRRAMALIEERAVDLEPLVTEVVPLSDWERAFAATRAGEGVKIVLDPR